MSEVYETDVLQDRGTREGAQAAAEYWECCEADDRVGGIDTVFGFGALENCEPKDWAAIPEVLRASYTEAFESGFAEEWQNLIDKAADDDDDDDDDRVDEDEAP